MTPSTTRRTAQGMRVTCNPVALGQTHGGIVAAAILIACSQPSMPARAQAPPNGHSANDYLHLEWYYSQEEKEGRLVFEYDVLEPITLDRWDDPLDIQVTYPAEGVELRATELGFEGRLSAAWHPIIPIPPGEMPFVTIQTIPEPPVLATLGLGAAALATVRHQRRREESHT